MTRTTIASFDIFQSLTNGHECGHLINFVECACHEFCQGVSKSPPSCSAKGLDLDEKISRAAKVITVCPVDGNQQWDRWSESLQEYREIRSRERVSTENHRNFRLCKTSRWFELPTAVCSARCYFRCSIVINVIFANSETRSAQIVGVCFVSGRRDHVLELHARWAQNQDKRRSRRQQWQIETQKGNAIFTPRPPAHQVRAMTWLIPHHPPQPFACTKAQILIRIVSTGLTLRHGTAWHGMGGPGSLHRETVAEREKTKQISPNLSQMCVGRSWCAL